MDLFELFASIGLDISEFESGIDDVESGSDSAADALEEIGDATSSAEDGLDSVGDAGDDAASGLDSAGDSADDASSGLDELGSAGDEAASGLDSAADAADDAASSFDSLGDAAGSSGDSLGGLDIAFGNLAAQGISGAIGAIGNFVTGTIETADNIDKMSQKIGISTNAYQEWSYICDICGANVDGLKNGMKTLGNVILDAADGSQTANEKLAAVGLTIEDLDGLSQEQQLNLVVSAIQEMGEGAERTAAATDLLGKAGTDMAAVFNMTAEETQALRDEAYDLGIILSEDAVQAGADMNDSITRLQDSFSGMTGNLAAEVMPVMSDFLDFLSYDVLGGIMSVMDGSATLDEVFTNVFTTVSETGTQAFEGFVAAANDVIPKITEAMPQIIDSITSFVLDAAPDIMNSAIEMFLGIVDAIPVVLDQILSTLPEIIDGIFNFIAEAAPQVMEGATTMFTGIIDAIPETISSITANLPQILESIVNGLISAVPQILEGALQMFMGIVQSIPQVAASVVQAIPEIIGAIVSTLIGAIPQILSAALELLGNIVTSIPQIAADVIQAVPQIITGLVQGLLNGIGSVLDAAKELGSSILSGIKGFLGINSPSTVMMEQGEYITEGLVEGIDTMPDQVDSILTQVEAIIEAWGQNLGSGVAASAMAMVTAFGETISQIPSQVESYLTSAYDIMQNWCTQMTAAAQTVGTEVVTTINTQISTLPGLLSGQFNSALSTFTSFSSSWMSQTSSTTTNIISTFTTFCTNWVSQATSTTTNLQSLFSTYYADWMSLTSDTLSTFSSDMDTFNQEWQESTTEHTTSLLETFITFYTDWQTQTTETTTSIATTVTTFLTQIATEFTTKLNEITTAVTTWGTEVVAQFKTVGENAMKGVVEGLEAGSGAVYNKVREIARKMVSEMESELDVGSPSKVFRDDIGLMIGEGLALGIEDSTRYVDDAMDNLMSLTEVGDQVSAAVKTYSGNNTAESSREKQGITVNQYINSEKATAAELMREARYQQQRAILMGVA